MDEATATAERLADPAVLGRVLMCKAIVERLGLELAAACDTGRRALGLLRPEALWERADVMMNMAVHYMWAGRFAEADLLLPEIEHVANRAGHHAALSIREFTSPLRGYSDHKYGTIDI